MSQQETVSITRAPRQVAKVELEALGRGIEIFDKNFEEKDEVTFKLGRLVLMGTIIGRTRSNFLIVRYTADQRVQEMAFDPAKLKKVQKA